MSSDSTSIREVEPENAEAVLTLRLMVPEVVSESEDVYHLARTKPPEFAVESSIVRQDGTVTGTALVEGEDEVVAHCAHVDGRTADGRGWGYGKTVSIEGRSADEVAVHLSLYWTAQDGSVGDLDEFLVVRWLGSARAELAGGGWVAAEITPIGGQAERITSSTR